MLDRKVLLDNFTHLFEFIYATGQLCIECLVYKNFVLLWLSDMHMIICV